MQYFADWMTAVVRRYWALSIAIHHSIQATCGAYQAQ
jgi:hypothetical protein